VLKAKYGEELDRLVERAFPFLFRARLNPNWLSAAGVLVSLAGAVAFAQGAFRSGGVLILAGGFFDLVDGVVARQQGRASRWGAFLDSTLDRLVDMGLLLGILMHYAAAGALLWAWLAGLGLVATVMVSYTKARAESLVPDFKGGLLERAERLLILVAGAFLGAMPVALGVVAVGSTITAFQRMTLAYRRLAQGDPAR
jgi:CDP-diacylglycerol--glycerol-3-phosphate 3-phosphatidyltransferase